MLDDPRLLVVDDEEAICEGCRRIFSRQGFCVEKSSDAVEGLGLATARDYSAILLDIKMPAMDGLEFLEALRSKKPEVPVILMTGYPSIPNAVSAIRLGASGYVTKPFTPEEISEAVHKFVRRPEAAGPRSAASVAADAWTPAEEGGSFWQQSWLQAGKDGTVRAGALLSRAEANGAKVTRLPGIGEVVYQGLPLAAVTLADGAERHIASPVSGLVVSVHESLLTDSSSLVCCPCTEGWMAAICPTRLEEELKNCTRRSVVLLNPNGGTVRTQRERLIALGCRVRGAANWDDLAPALENQGTRVVVMDAAEFGDDGPALVGRINAAAPSLRVVLIAGAGCQRESAYRAERIFYYAVEPFADHEIADILDAAFRPNGYAAAASEKRKAPAGPLCGITITNRNGVKVRLVAAPGLLRREEGIGAMIRHKLLDRLFPMETLSGDARLEPAELLKLAAQCDRLVVLLARNVNRLPGALVRDTKAEFVSISDPTAGKVTILVIQPDAEGGLAHLDATTAAALAEQIVNDMASY